MKTLIFRAAAPYLASLMFLYSLFVLLRGHNEPGGGFIGGLIAAAALAIYSIATGADDVRRAIRVHPMAIAGSGLLLAVLSGVPSVFLGVPYLTGLWPDLDLFGLGIIPSTPFFFDVGVYLVVLGALSSVALALSQEEMR
jgi:multicomponent Na+:H+ antiporter subunit B